MKRVIIILCAIISFQLSAQYSVKKTFQTTLGVGITNYGPPMFLALDYGIIRDLSFGLEFNNRFSNETFFKYRIIGANAHLNYHPNHLFKIYDEHWDVYLGPHYSYWTVSRSSKNIELDSVTMGMGGQIGMNYFFNRHFAFNAEIQATKLNRENYLKEESEYVGGFKIGGVFKF